MRLAFAVAAHLEPEILIVDEVLAVGDAEFQKKCLGKMSEVAGHGRTVLFVSHNIAAIQMLCGSSILLKDGTLQTIGTTTDVLSQYANSWRNKAGVDRINHRQGSNPINSVFINVAKSTSKKLFIDLKLNIVEDDFFEIRAFVKGGNSEAIGVISVGGFGSSGVLLCREQKLISLQIDVSMLAQGSYLIGMELVRVRDGKQYNAHDIIAYNHNAVTLSGEVKALSAEWGFGILRFPTKIV